MGFAFFKLYHMITLIINIILAFSAVSASIIAALALKQSFVIRREERLSKRAYLAPSKEPGHLRAAEFFPDDQEAPLTISIQNYGINPASKIEISIISFNHLDVDGTNEITEPILRLSFYSENPIPRDATLLVKLRVQNIIDFENHNFDVMSSNYLVLQVKYVDSILNNNYEDKFYWILDDNGNFNDVVDEHIESLINLGNQYLAT